MKLKTDLATSIIAAVIGVVISYVICNLLLPPLENVTFNTLSSSNNYTLVEPNDDVFNFRALNPTVEVYVGECSEYDENGECKDSITSVSEDEATTEDETQTANPDNSGQGQ